MPLDILPGCADLAVAADAAVEDDSFAGVSEAELVGVLCAWDRVEAHAAAHKLAAVAELRHDHRLKQHPKWKVDQLPDGTFTWTTRAGRIYTAEPTRHPI
jgi:hypothetical protein